MLTRRRRLMVNPAPPAVRWPRNRPPARMSVVMASPSPACARRLGSAERVEMRAAPRCYAGAGVPFTLVTTRWSCGCKTPSPRIRPPGGAEDGMSALIRMFRNAWWHQPWVPHAGGDIRVLVSVTSMAARQRRGRC